MGIMSLKINLAKHHIGTRELPVEPRFSRYGISFILEAELLRAQQPAVRAVQDYARVADDA